MKNSVRLLIFLAAGLLSASPLVAQEVSDAVCAAMQGQKFSLAMEECGQQPRDFAPQAPYSSLDAAEAGLNLPAERQVSDQLVVYNRTRPYDDVVEGEDVDGYDDAPVRTSPWVMTDPAPKSSRRGRSPLVPRSNRYDHFVQTVGEDYRIDPLFLKAVMHIESRSNPSAVSPKGARGLMQVMPSTARLLGLQNPEQRLFEPLTNLATGAKLLKKLQGRYGLNLRLILAAYNAGEGAVRRYGMQIPPYRETQEYVKNVLATYDHLRRTKDSEGQIR